MREGSIPSRGTKDLYWRNWYTAIEGESSGNSPEMVTGSNPVYKSFNLGLMPMAGQRSCTAIVWVRLPQYPLRRCGEIGKHNGFKHRRFGLQVRCLSPVQNDRVAQLAEAEVLEASQ